MPPVISVENLSKSYTLGTIGTGTFSHDLAVWWARVRGKPNPLLRIGETDHGNRVGEEIWALKDVSFQVQQGEVLGVIGRNGAGKSTLLKILSRVTAPTSGEVKVKGRIASLLEVGTGFHPELTGRENIYLNGAILGMTKQEVTRKFDEIVDFAELLKFIDTPVKRYSSGMYVRLAFAVAAHLESEILLVDEVLAVGDAEFQKKCLGKMGDVAHNEGRTVLFVSHNMASMKDLCTIGLYIKQGIANSIEPIISVIKKYQIQNEVNLLFNSNILIKGQPKGEINVQLSNKEDKISRIFNTWEKVNFSFSIKLDDDVNDAGLEVLFKTDDGLNILKLTTKPFGNTNIRIRKNVEKRFILTIPNLPLASGDYLIHIGLSRPLKGFISDGLVEVGKITVRDTLVFGGNRPLIRKQSYITCEHYWEEI